LIRAPQRTRAARHRRCRFRLADPVRPAAAPALPAADAGTVARPALAFRSLRIGGWCGSGAAGPDGPRRRQQTEVAAPRFLHPQRGEARLSERCHEGGKPCALFWQPERLHCCLATTAAIPAHAAESWWPWPPPTSAILTSHDVNPDNMLAWHVFGTLSPHRSPGRHRSGPGVVGGGGGRPVLGVPPGATRNSRDALAIHRQRRGLHALPDAKGGRPDAVLHRHTEVGGNDRSARSAHCGAAYPSRRTPTLPARLAGFFILSATLPAATRRHPLSIRPPSAACPLPPSSDFDSLRNDQRHRALSPHPLRQRDVAVLEANHAYWGPAPHWDRVTSVR